MYNAFGQIVIFRSITAIYKMSVYRIYKYVVVVGDAADVYTSVNYANL